MLLNLVTSVYLHKYYFCASHHGVCNHRHRLAAGRRQAAGCGSKDFREKSLVVDSGGPVQPQPCEKVSTVVKIDNCHRERVQLQLLHTPLSLVTVDRLII